MTQAPTNDALPADDALLTTKQAAVRLGISRRHLYNLIYAREIETIRIPSTKGNQGEHRIEPAELERFKDRYRQPATAAS